MLGAVVTQQRLQLQVDGTLRLKGGECSIQHGSSGSQRVALLLGGRRAQSRAPPHPELHPPRAQAAQNWRRGGLHPAQRKTTRRDLKRPAVQHQGRRQWPLHGIWSGRPAIFNGAFLSAPEFKVHNNQLDFFPF